MGRKNYLDDLAKAQALRFGNISKIVSREDGELTFTLQASGLNTTKITAMISGRWNELAHEPCPEEVYSLHMLHVLPLFPRMLSLKLPAIIASKSTAFLVCIPF